MFSDDFNERIEEHNIIFEKFNNKNEESKLHDHFAGLAMQGLISKFDYNDIVSRNADEAIAITAYQIADAMLKARKEVKP